MKPAASLNARLLVRKGHATPSHLTRAIALDDPPLLPRALSADQSDFAQTENRDGDPDHPRRIEPILDTAPDPIPATRTSPETPALGIESDHPEHNSSLVQTEPGSRDRLQIVETKSAATTRQPAPTPISSRTEPARKVRKRPVGAGRRIAMTVRLSHQQHRELHAFADRRGRTCQDVFVRALEAYMAICP